MQTVAFLGCSHIHTPNFIKTIKARNDIKIKYIWDPNQNLAERIAREVNSQQITDLPGIWDDPSISGVIICSQTNLHEQLVINAARAHKHIFVEKPLGFGKVDSAKMRDEITKAGVIFQSGYFMRGRDTILKVKQLINQGAFGKITRLRLSNCHSGGLDGWFVNKDWSWMTRLPEAGVGGFGDLGTHILDLALYLLQSPVQRVTASIKVVNGNFGNCDESGEGIMELQNGVTICLAAGWVDVANPVTLQLSGTEGHAMIYDGKLFMKSKNIEGADGTTPLSDLPPSLPHAFDMYLDSLIGKQGACLVTPEEAYRNSVIMEAFYIAAKNNVWISL